MIYLFSYLNLIEITWAVCISRANNQSVTPKILVQVYDSIIYNEFNLNYIFTNHLMDHLHWHLQKGRDDFKNNLSCENFYLLAYFSMVGQLTTFFVNLCNKIHQQINHPKTFILQKYIYCHLHPYKPINLIQVYIYFSFLISILTICLLNYHLYAVNAKSKNQLIH